MNILVTICARGGSKGIPGKNIKPLAGRPLIDYTIRAAREFLKGKSGNIALSTDDAEIKRVAGNCGLPSDYTRPEHLATDSAGKMDTINDLLEYEEKNRNIRYDLILDLDVTSPLRTIGDLEKGLQTIISNDDALNLFSVNPANRNPYFNMVEADNNGFYSLVKKKAGVTLTRQSAPAVFDLNASFYFYKRAFFEKGWKTPLSDKALIYVMNHICFDLDHPIDFTFLEYLLTQNKLDFKLI